MKFLVTLLLSFLFISQAQEVQVKDFTSESKAEREARMKWWTEARFGMFIHWGLYAIPAGEWKGATNHAERLPST